MRVKVLWLGSGARLERPRRAGDLGPTQDRVVVVVDVRNRSVHAEHLAPFVGGALHDGLVPGGK